MVYAGDDYRGDGGHLAVLFDIFPLSGEGRTGLNFDGYVAFLVIVSFVGQVPELSVLHDAHGVDCHAGRRCLG